MTSNDTARRPTLVIFSGLPGSGKSTVAKAVAHTLRIPYLRIDTIEQGLRDLCGIDVAGEGYRLAYRIAADNLRLGSSVIADSCNPIELTRNEWDAVARDAGAEPLNVEVVCSDPAEHRRRVESRAGEVPGLTLPTWEEVQQREYHTWTRDRLIVDTANRSVAECAQAIIARLTAEPFA